MALTKTDLASLTGDQQTAIRQYTDQYNAAKAAGDAQAMASAHALAEQVRGKAGYSGGANGASVVKNPAAAPATAGGYSVTPTKTSEQMGQYVKDFEAQNGNAADGYTNGFSGKMNMRSEANAIRQQMLENTQNWWKAPDQATKDYLHQQNVALNKLLSDSTGGSVSNYDAKTGAWSTNNGTYGYGRITYDPAMLKQLYGGGMYTKNPDGTMTEGYVDGTGTELKGYSDADIAKLYGGMQSQRYKNYVDYQQVRNKETPTDYSGDFSNGKAGPLSSLLAGTNHDPSSGINTSAGQGNLAQYSAGGQHAYVDGNGIIQSGTGIFNAQYTDGKHDPSVYQGNNGAGLAQGSMSPYYDQVVNGNSPYGGSSSGGSSGSMGAAGSADGLQAGYAPDMEGQLSAWRDAANQQAVSSADYATNQAVKELQRTQEDADAKYQTERNQVSADEQRSLDNSALYSEMRGDRGGIGQAQYNAIQNTAATNRATVNGEQTKLATDTQRQITDLRAKGEYDKADKLLGISQAYLQQLMAMEKWAAQYNLSVDQFNENVKQWEQDYALKVAQITGNYGGQPTLAARQQNFSEQKYDESALSSAGSALLKAGILPSAKQLSAMGITSAQAGAMLAAKTAKKSAGGRTSSRASAASGAQDYEGLYAAAYASPNAPSYIANNYKKFGFTKSTGLAGGYTDWRSAPVAGGQGALYKTNYNNLVKYAAQVVKNGGVKYAYSALHDQGYSDAVIDRVFASLGK
jgi:hypothetical protein